MPYIGTIQASSESSPIDGKHWLALIESHPSLRHVPPAMGINPFTKKPCEYNAPSSTGQITAEGVPVGAIEWAMDGFPELIVSADDGRTAHVAKVAADVAARLGAKFVLHDER